MWQDPSAARDGDIEEAIAALKVFRERTFDPDQGVGSAAQPSQESKLDPLQEILAHEVSQVFGDQPIRTKSLDEEEAGASSRPHANEDASEENGSEGSKRGNQTDADQSDEGQENEDGDGDWQSSADDAREADSDSHAIASSRNRKGKVKKTTKKSRACPTCGTKIDSSRAGREKHYRASPACRPADELTPQIASGLVLDLSDRLPYRAMMKKDMKLWARFTTSTNTCRTYGSVAQQLLWLFRQLRPVVYDNEWTEEDTGAFTSDCDQCADAASILKLVQRLELETIDWAKVYVLWDEERQEAAGGKQKKKGQKKRPHADISSGDETLARRPRKDESQTLTDKIAQDLAAVAGKIDAGENTAAEAAPDKGEATQAAEEQTAHEAEERPHVDAEQQVSSVAVVDASLPAQGAAEQGTVGVSVQVERMLVEPTPADQAGPVEANEQKAAEMEQSEMHQQEQETVQAGGGHQDAMVTTEDEAEEAGPEHKLEIATAREAEDEGAGGEGEGVADDDWEEGGMEDFTLGSVVEVTLDDGDKALALVTQLPEMAQHAGEGTHQITFFDDDMRLIIADFLHVQLPNDFVRLVIPGRPEPALPAGWVPVPMGKRTVYLGPKGYVCRTIAEVFDYLEGYLSNNGRDRIRRGRNPLSGGKKPTLSPHKRGGDGQKQNCGVKTFVQGPEALGTAEEGSPVGAAAGAAGAMAEAGPSRQRREGESENEEGQAGRAETAHHKDEDVSEEAAARPVDHGDGGQPGPETAEKKETAEKTETEEKKDTAEKTETEEKKETEEKMETEEKQETEEKKEAAANNEAAGAEAAKQEPYLPKVGALVEVRSRPHGQAWWDAVVMDIRNEGSEALTRFVGFEGMDEWVPLTPRSLRRRSKQCMSFEDCSVGQHVVALTSFGQWFDAVVMESRRRKGQTKAKFRVHYEEPEACRDDDGNPLYSEWRKLGELRVRMS